MGTGKHRMPSLHCHQWPVHTFCRTANVDTEVSVVRIVEGTKILWVLASANLDEAHWPAADQFDIGRRPVGHVALANGIHGCVGQNVARAEGEAVLTVIADKVGSSNWLASRYGVQTTRCLLWPGFPSPSELHRFLS